MNLQLKDRYDNSPKNATFPDRRQIFRGYHWAYMAIAMLLFAQVTAAYLLGNHYFSVTLLDVFEIREEIDNVAGFLIFPLLVIGIVAITITRRQKERPARLLLRWMRFRSDWLIRGFLVVVAYPTTAKSFSVLKATIPKTVGFWADPMFRDWDRWLLGTDAWIIPHSTLPTWTLYAIDRIYVLWFTFVALTIGLFSFTRNARLQAQGALAFFAAWLFLGVVLASALGSVGPIFYDTFYGQVEFAKLNAAMNSAHEQNKLAAKFAIEFLLKHIDQPVLGVGISAMPSMHVSMAWLGFLISRQFSGRLFLQVFCFVFSLLTLLGSVYLGWHYLVDGLMAIIGTTIIWLLAGKFVDAVYRPRRIKSVETPKAVCPS